MKIEVEITKKYFIAIMATILVIAGALFVVSYNSVPANPAVMGQSLDEINISNIEESLEWGWPSGGYCIFKKGDCPAGFQEGNRHWDDEDDSNSNSKSGELPDGSYGRNTQIYFCCKDA